MHREREHLTRLLTWKQLKEIFGIPFCREHARRLEKKGRFPKRLRLSPQKIAYLETEIVDWLKARAEERSSGIDPDDE
jgi:prophage regulatory protein